MIKVEHIYKIYGEDENRIKALDNVNLLINRGQFVSIMGPSGSGKSTLLNIISGLDKPTSGKVFINGNNIHELKDNKLSEFRRKNIGFVFQSFNLIPTLTIEKNVKLPILFDKGKIDEEYFNELIDMLEIKNRINHMPHEISGGQQQRVAIARALIAKPSIIFADEPTGNLDTKTGKKIIDLFIDITKKFKTTIVLITHNLEIAELADRKLNIVDGILYEDVKCQ
ncbi:ABC transporter ATP-binding protein [Clostridium perfringens]